MADYYPLATRPSTTAQAKDGTSLESQRQALAEAGASLVQARQLQQSDPAQALQAMRERVRIVSGEVETMRREDRRWAVGCRGHDAAAKVVVLATGAEPAPTGTPRATARLIEAIQPIRGQIGVAAGYLVDHVVRGPGAYVAPMGPGAVVGATMEPGRRDTAPDAAAGERLLQAAWRVLNRTPGTLEVEWRAGVRGASSDGLPLAGAAPGGPGLFMALAPRRNGWLLGPLAGSAVADWIEGRAPSPDAAPGSTACGAGRARARDRVMVPPHARLEPLAVAVGQRDRRDRQPEQRGGHARDAVEGFAGRRIQQVQPAQCFQARRFDRKA